MSGNSPTTSVRSDTPSPHGAGPVESFSTTETKLTPRDRWLIGTLALLMCYAVSVHYMILTDPRPIEYREGAQMLLTKEIQKGEDIYAFENQPYTLNVYGMVYHKFASFVSPSSGVSFLPLRLITAFFILLSCCLIVFSFDRNRIGLIAGVVAAGVWYAHTLRLWGICSRPDMMAMFFYLCAVFIPWKMRFTNGSLVISCVCSTLAFLTKPYFAAGIIFVIAYLFLQRRYLHFLGTSVVFAMIFFGSLFVVSHWYEAYLYNTIFISMGYTGSEIQWKWLSMQIVRFAGVNLPLFAALAWAFHVTRRKQAPADTGHTTKTAYAWLVARLESLSYPWVAGLCATVILLKIAQNRGSHEYFFHLLSPILIVGAYRYLASRGQITPILLAGSLQVAILSSPFPNFESDKWQAVEDMLVGESSVLHSPTTVHLAIAREEQVYDSGQTEYFRSGLSKGKRFFPQAVKAWDGFNDDIAEKVRNREFSLVLLNARMPSIIDRETLGKHYRLAGTMPAPLHRHRGNVLELWRPINTP